MRRRPSRGPAPRPPDWALEMGLPPPRRRESFCSYCARLGLDCEELLADLNETTAPLANSRLAARISRDAPESFKRYLQARHAAV